MKNITNIIIAILIALIFSSTIIAQEGRKEKINNEVQEVIKTEKIKLKERIKAINKQLENGEISQEEAMDLKEEAAELHAERIEDQIEEIEDMLEEEFDELENTIEKITSSLKYKSKSKKQKDKRTKSDIYLAWGLKNVISNGDLSTLKDTDFSPVKSTYFELGKNYKTRIMKNKGGLYIDYGFGFSWSKLSPEDSKAYFKLNEKQTDLAINNIEFDKVSFQNTQFIIPVHLEFDFTKPKIDEEHKIFRSNKALRLGAGGFLGLNFNTKQLLKYEEDGIKIKEYQKNSFNTSPFIYGYSVYAGYQNMVIYGKVFLNEIFKDNTIKENYVSLGLRWNLD